VTPGTSRPQVLSQQNIAPSDRSGSVRSLEDIRFENSSQLSPRYCLNCSVLFLFKKIKPNIYLFKIRASYHTSEFFNPARYQTSASSTLLDEASPLVKFLYNSDTNLNMFPDVNFAREQPLLSLGPGTHHIFKNS